MTPFQIVKKCSACRLLLGDDMTRFFPFGLANEQTPRPYAVYQVISGQPVDCLSGSTSMDSVSYQIDVYSDDYNSADLAYNAIRRALENHCQVTSINGTTRDPSTKDWRITFSIKQFAKRS